jgi:hypothetical protein
VGLEYGRHDQSCRPAAAAARLSAARAFIGRFPAATEILIVAAARGAADDLARRITLMRGATFGLHRASFVQLVVRLAMAAMALRGFGHSAARADTIPDREAPARLEDVDIRPNRRMAPRLPASCVSHRLLT